MAQVTNINFKTLHTKSEAAILDYYGAGLKDEYTANFHRDYSYSDEQREKFGAVCEKWFETDDYKNGDKNLTGYVMCCEGLGLCGMSGWVIFLIILLVLGALAGGAAAFWFFYWKRKN